jgi:hypothetical protein
MCNPRVSGIAPVGRTNHRGTETERRKKRKDGTLRSSLCLCASVVSSSFRGIAGQTLPASRLMGVQRPRRWSVEGGIPTRSVGTRLSFPARSVKEIHLLRESPKLPAPSPPALPMQHNQSNSNPDYRMQHQHHHRGTRRMLFQSRRQHGFRHIFRQAAVQAAFAPVG